VAQLKCPGQDQRYWKPDDIFDVSCSWCGHVFEMWKDEPVRLCPSCKKEVQNPRLDMGCAEWCLYAKDCPGVAAKQTKSE
jgi:hypothetical protein